MAEAAMSLPTAGQTGAASLPRASEAPADGDTPVASASSAELGADAVGGSAGEPPAADASGAEADDAITLLPPELRQPPDTPCNPKLEVCLPFRF